MHASRIPRPCRSRSPHAHSGDASLLVLARLGESTVAVASGRVGGLESVSEVALWSIWCSQMTGRSMPDTANDKAEFLFETHSLSPADFREGTRSLSQKSRYGQPGACQQPVEICLIPPMTRRNFFLRQTPSPSPTGRKPSVLVSSSGSDHLGETPRGRWGGRCG